MKFIITEEEKKNILSLYEDVTALDAKKPKKPKLAPKYSETVHEWGDKKIYLGVNDDGTISYYQQGVVDANNKPIPILPQSNGYLSGLSSNVMTAYLSMFNDWFSAGIPYHLGKEYKTKVDENIKNKSRAFAKWDENWEKQYAKQYADEFGPKGYYIG